MKHASKAWFLWWACYTLNATDPNFEEYTSEIIDLYGIATCIMRWLGLRVDIFNALSWDKIIEIAFFFALHIKRNGGKFKFWKNYLDYFWSINNYEFGHVWKVRLRAFSSKYFNSLKTFCLAFPKYKRWDYKKRSKSPDTKFFSVSQIKAKRLISSKYFYILMFPKPFSIC